MRAKATRRFVIQDRDREIFRFLGEHETATFAQVRQKFWAASVTDKTAHDRLDKLRKEGYIVRHTYTTTTNGRTTTRYSITRKALRELEPATTERLYTGKLIDREVEQAIKGVEARLELERRGYQVTGWISERQLQRAQHVAIAHARRAGRPATAAAISDGQAIIADSKTGEIATIDVEIDGQYYGKMLCQKVQGFAGRPVFWACPPRRAALVRRAASPEYSRDYRMIDQRLIRQRRH